MIQGASFDHLAIAVERHADAWPRFVARLGGQWRSGGRTIGFAPAQLAFARGSRLEILEPNQPERNDFLRRFLDRGGPGPHHLTFKVADLDEAIATVEAAGWPTMGHDRSDPGWQEAFIHPKAGPGIVIQLAQAAGGEWTSPRPSDFPEAAPPPADLRAVALAVPSLDDGLVLFEKSLGGKVTATGDDERIDRARWAELEWSGPNRLRLLEPHPGGPLAARLGDRAGRLDHITFALEDPAAEPGVGAIGEGMWEVPPDSVCGTRLRLVMDR